MVRIHHELRREAIRHGKCRASSARIDLRIAAARIVPRTDAMMPVQTERDAKLVVRRRKSIDDMPTKHLQIVPRLQAVLRESSIQRCRIRMIDIAGRRDIDIRRIRAVIPYSFTPKPHFVKTQHIIALPSAELEITLEADADILRFVSYRPLRIASSISCCRHGTVIPLRIKQAAAVPLNPARIIFLVIASIQECLRMFADLLLMIQNERPIVIRVLRPIR